MKIIPVPVRDDNYAYLLIDEASKTAAAVDPYDVTKVAAAAEANDVQIVAGITTHHHYDHAGGNQVNLYSTPSSVADLFVEQLGLCACVSNLVN